MAKLPDIAGAVFPTLEQIDGGEGAHHRAAGTRSSASTSSTASDPTTSTAPAVTRCRRDASDARGAPDRRVPGAVASAGPGSGLVPFFALRVAVPAASRSRYLVVGSFQDTRRAARRSTNYADLLARQHVVNGLPQQHRDQPRHRDRWAGIFGFLLAYAVILGGLPAASAAALMTFSRRGLELRRRAAGPGLHLHPGPARARDGVPAGRPRHRHLRAAGFTLYSKIGLEIVYLYFQFPLMVLIIAPAIDGLQAGVAGGGREHGREHVAVLAPRRPADPHARRSWAR